ncbi:hypothetical protein HPP92_007924 [Vanilla planifolia]|uniref:Uncharacterized protein n=1 Tax=Vanilla planifolia TaxID=51239 RepID=A0A835RF49_VANPL|nr:hypothetical protein HPP92_007924 [Vanilla planifolia]
MEVDTPPKKKRLGGSHLGAEFYGIEREGGITISCASVFSRHQVASLVQVASLISQPGLSNCFLVLNHLSD